MVSSDPVEADLLHAIGAGDVTCRAIYADWLEAHGDLDRAEFVRILDRIHRGAAADFGGLVYELRELGRDTAIEWRAIVARDLIGYFPELAWLTQAPRRAARRHVGEFQLPSELRYLEALAPEPTLEPTTPITVTPLQRALDLTTAAPARVLADLVAALRARLRP